MKFTILLGTLCILALTNLKAQLPDDFSDKPYLGKISIPPPGVAGLARFTDMPVSLYTGTPNISIPIYTINTGTFTWPISLDYNASGIRVSENASNVGLGWTLRAEGAIIQNILGTPDNGSYQANGLNWTNAAILPNNSADYTLMESLSNQSIDGAPDLYLYNFNGHSGKFILANEIKLLPKANLLVTSWQEGTQKFWKIVAEDGTQYFFGAVETTLTRSGASSSPSQSWYLTKVVDANSTDSLVFEYENTVMDMGMGKSYEINNWADYQGVGFWAVDMAPNDPPIQGLLSQYTLTTNGKQLKRILFNHGSVEYDIAWNDRQDLATTGSSALNVPRVRNILVKDKDGNVIKAAHLEHDYFGPANGVVDDKRLRLKGVEFASTVPATISAPDQRYFLEYNATELPAKSSNAIDHWGYFNGASNATLIPSLNYYGQFHYYGADRATNASKVKAGMLEKIIYPTGGYTRFVWEPHQKSFSTSGYWQVIRPDSNIIASAVGQGTGWNLTTDESNGIFAVPDNDTFNNMKAYIKAEASYPPNSLSQYINHAASKMTIYKFDNNSSSIIKTISFSHNPGNVYTRIDSINLQRGQSYWFKVETQGGAGYKMSGWMKAKWPKLVYIPGSTYTDLYGGCRIKQIISHDTANQDDLIKNYSYAGLQVKSSPKYFREIKKFWDPDEGQVNNTPCNEFTVPGVLLTSNSIFNLGSGSHAGYSNITESAGTGAGYTEYTFSNFDTDQVGVLDANWRRGRLLRKQVFASGGSPVSETQYYNKRITLPNERFAGHTARSCGKHPCSSEANAHLGSFPAFWSQEVYDFQVDWLYTDTVKEIDFMTGQTKIIANGFDNPQHMLPTRYSTVNSDGSKTTKYTKYPTDFTLSGTMNSNETQALKLLQDKHIHTYPIEQYVQKLPTGSSTPLTIGASYTAFKTIGTSNDKVVGNKDYALDINQGISNFQPMNVSGNVVNKDSRYSEKTFAKDYDTRYNLLTLRTEGDNDFGYIWGCNNTMTIAKVANKVSDYLPAFTSFEKESKGNWTYNDNGVVTSDVLTGKQAFNLAYGGAGPAVYIETPQNPGAPHQIVPGRYIVSYWKKNGTVAVNGSNPSLTGATANGWTYCEHTFVDPYNILQVSGTALIDELRFYTEGSLMESYTYNPLIGITSVNNAANHVILYEYDAMGRLAIERDVFGKIIKQHTYKYQVTE